MESSPRKTCRPSTRGNGGRSQEDLVLINQDGSASFPLALMAFGAVMIASGSWRLGVVFVVAGIMLASAAVATSSLAEIDKLEIRYNVWDAEDVVQELESLASTNLANMTQNQRDGFLEKRRIYCIAGLEALAKKFGKQEQENTTKKKHNERTNKQDRTPQSNVDNQLELKCLQAAYIAYRLFPVHNDQVIALALSLHALVAKNAKVRQCHLFEADIYGLHLPIQCMRESLLQAKQESDEDKEQQAAELQRKACLLLGALGDGEADIATKIAEGDGLAAALDAMNWYRYHEDVANWALWAIFILNYENLPNKVRSVELGCVTIIIQTLRSVTDCLEVSRHGVAILFDLLRDDPVHQAQNFMDPWRIRKSALAAGLHEAILKAMAQFSDTIDIIMMGQEILAGTDYRGSMPQYQPRTEDLAD